MSSFLFAIRPCCRKLLTPSQFTLRHCSSAVEGRQPIEGEGSDQPLAQGPVDDDYAYNNVEKKKGKLKPIHTVEEQIGYMKSKAFENAYNGLPIYKWYRRNMKMQEIMQPPPRLICIDKDGRIKLNNACPICRDEYLFFDYRNPDLIKQFLAPGTDEPISMLKSGLCREQYNNLRAQLLKAREHGTLEFCVEFRVFDYSQWYPDWKADDVEEDEKPVSRRHFSIESMLPNETIKFPEHNPDNRRGMYWRAHDKFARKAK